MAWRVDYVDVVVVIEDAGGFWAALLLTYRMVIPFSLYSWLESMAHSSLIFTPPDLRSVSTRVVLPWSTWAMMATFLVLSRNCWALLATWATLLNHPQVLSVREAGPGAWSIDRTSNLFNINNKFNSGNYSPSIYLILTATFASRR